MNWSKCHEAEAFFLRLLLIVIEGIQEIKTLEIMSVGITLGSRAAMNLCCPLDT